MYTAFYGLRELPFDLSPNPKYLLMTPRHREALANLQYGISSRKSITLLLGEAGTGKTTLVRAALESDACRGARILHLNNPALKRNEFIEFLARGFDSRRRSDDLEDDDAARARAGAQRAAYGGGDDRARDRRGAEPVARAARGNPAPREHRDIHREAAARRPRRAARAGRPAQRAVAAPVEAARGAALHLGLLSPTETAAYIAGRLRVAGGDAGQIFTREAVEIVAERSGGVPRTVNVICDNALVGGFAAGAKPVDARIVRDVCEEFDLGIRAADQRRARRQQSRSSDGRREGGRSGGKAGRCSAPSAAGAGFPSSDWNWSYEPNWRCAEAGRH